MSNINHPFVYAIIMFIAGFGIPVAATLSGTLGGKLQNPVLAATILFGVGFLAAALFLLFSQGIPSISDYSSSEKVPVRYYLGGLFILFYILTVTWIGPKFGIGNAIAFVLLGQLTSMTLIDHFSLFNAPHYPISLQRFIGLIIMAIGVFLVVRKN